MFGAVGSTLLHAMWRLRCKVIERSAVQSWTSRKSTKWHGMPDSRCRVISGGQWIWTGGDGWDCMLWKVEGRRENGRRRVSDSCNGGGGQRLRHLTGFFHPHNLLSNCYLQRCHHTLASYEIKVLPAMPFPTSPRTAAAHSHLPPPRRVLFTSTNSYFSFFCYQIRIQDLSPRQCECLLFFFFLYIAGGCCNNLLIIGRYIV